METYIFVCGVFAVYGDGLEVLSLDEFTLEAMDIKKDCRIFAGNPFVKKKGGGHFKLSAHSVLAQPPLNRRSPLASKRYRLPTAAAAEQEE
jgi:hypothetical protein